MLARDLGRAVGGAVVDHEHVRVGQLAAQLVEHGRQVGLLVPRGYEDDRVTLLGHARESSRRIRVAPTVRSEIRERRRSAGNRREVGRDLRPRRAGLRGRAGGDRVHLHRGADLAPDGALPPLLRHAGRRPPQVHPGERRRGGHEAVEQVQRHDLRRRAEPARLRARHELARPRAPGRHARDDRLALRGQGAEQPQRRLRALGRLDLLLRPLVRADARLRRGARARARLPGRLPDRSRRRRARARRRPRRATSSRTGSASLRTSRSSTSTTRRARTSTSTTRTPTARSRISGASSRGSAPGSSRRASRTG